MAKWPCLILKQYCKTTIDVTIESEELDENGVPIALANWSGMCNYQDKAKKVWTSDKVLVDVSGTCLIPGDIAPNIEDISKGVVKVFGMDRILALGQKSRNPDGSVNYTRLELR